MKKKELTSKDFWIKSRKGISLDITKAIPIKEWILSNIAISASEELQECFEIGCYPGRFLTIFGDQGMKLSGIDYTPGTERIGRLLKNRGYKVGDFLEEDFLQFDISKKFDIVCSFGFIEHFQDWRAVLLKQLQLVNEGGYLVVEVPNYRGFFQRIPRFFFDYKNFRAHNLNAMNPCEWEKLVISEGFTVISKEYFGGYRLGFSNKNKSLLYRKIRNIVKIILSTTVKTLYKDKESRNHSFFIGMICKKEQNKIAQEAAESTLANLTQGIWIIM